jgi:hypothetical protein
LTRLSTCIELVWSSTVDYERRKERAARIAAQVEEDDE